MNIDEAWNEVRKMAGFGAIIRNDIGGFVNAFCGNSEDAFSPLQAELVAFRESVYWAVNRGIQNLSFETDSLHIVEALRNLTLNLSIVGQMVEYIKTLLHPITEATITHTRRNTNSFAHRLAWIGVSLTQHCE
ncbi:uncharacterized protein [Malus domestica]|uniref:uncharacterized protein n=1 Tax=Malus domestica TaxID=3750 RepID=UPI003974BDB6